MYKEASKLKLRVATSSGNLSVEQLWDLNTKQLDVLAVSLEEEYKSSSAKSFLTRKTPKNKVTKLKFDIVLDILNTKMEEAENASEASKRKEHNARIDSLILDKKEEELRGKSVKDLEKMRM